MAKGDGGAHFVVGVVLESEAKRSESIVEQGEDVVEELVGEVAEA